MQKKEMKVMENRNVLKVTKSVLIYTFYRTVNYYNIFHGKKIQNYEAIFTSFSDLRMRRGLRASSNRRDFRLYHL